MTSTPAAQAAGINEGEPLETTAHRDGSPYPLRTMHLSDPKEGEPSR